MILNLLRGGVTQWELMMILLSIPVVLFSLSFHEMAHGWAAKKMGDPTAHYLGRVSLNPLSHLDPLGTLSMLLFGIGWAKPVPINPRNFRHPRKGMALTGLAGPLSNLILAFVALLGFQTLSACAELSFFFEKGILWYLPAAKLSFLDILALLLYVMATLNCSLAIFNLIPVPPFDGSRIFYFLLPDKYYFGVMRYERVIMIVTMVALFTGALDPVLFWLRQHLLLLLDSIIGLVPFL